MRASLKSGLLALAGGTLLLAGCEAGPRAGDGVVVGQSGVPAVGTTNAVAIQSGVAQFPYAQVDVDAMPIATADGSGDRNYVLLPRDTSLAIAVDGRVLDNNVVAAEMLVPRDNTTTTRTQGHLQIDPHQEVYFLANTFSDNGRLVLNEGDTPRVSGVVIGTERFPTTISTDELGLRVRETYDRFCAQAGYVSFNGHNALSLARQNPFTGPKGPQRIYVDVQGAEPFYQEIARPGQDMVVRWGVTGAVYHPVNGMEVAPPQEPGPGELEAIQIIDAPTTN